MNRRPWLGMGFSLVIHASLLALLLLAVWRDDSLPALVVDLREGFAPGAAAIRTLASEIRHVRETASSVLASRKGGDKSGGASSARGPEPTPARQPAALEPSAPPQPSAEAPAISPPPEPPPALLTAPVAPRPPTPVAEPLIAPPAAPQVATSKSRRETALLASPPAELVLSGPVAAAKNESAAHVAGGANVASSPSAPNASGGSSAAGLGASAGGTGISVGLAPSVAGPASGASAGGGPAQRGGGMAGVSSTGSNPGPSERGQGSGAPGPVVLSATAGGGSGVGTEYGPYLTALRQRIQHALRYPMSARRRGVSGTVNVEILILANGTVGGVTLLDSSTHSVLDDAALETIRSLPRMPLPPELPARSLRVRVPVVFEMR